MTTMRKTAVALAGAMLLALGAAQDARAAACGDINNSGGAPDAIDSAGLAAVVLNGGVTVASHCGNLGTLQCGDLVATGTINSGDLVASLQTAVGLEPLLQICTGFGPVLPCNSTVSGTVTSNQQWPAGCNTFVDGTVLVTNNAVVTMQAGAVVRGRKASTDGTPSALVFTANSKVNAPGTAAAPIVMTSDQGVGLRAKEDWGGLVMLGQAPVNFPGGTGACEGLPPGTCNFGGNNAADNNGLLRYVRVEFCGRELSPDNELNCLTMNGLGSTTSIDFVQANQGSDDGHEWFGGTVNAKHLVTTNMGDDMLDWQIGWTGNLQFALAHMNIAQIDGTGSNGIEADNNEFGFNNLPRSNPNVCNATMIGCVQQGAACAIVGGTTGGQGANLRRGTAGKIGNSIIMDFRVAGLDIDNDETINQGCTNSTTLKTTEPVLRVQDSILFNNGAAGTNQTIGSTSGANNCTPAQLAGLWAATEGLLITGTNPLPSVTGIYPAAVSNIYVPVDGGIADDAPDCADLNPAFFDPAPYVGAFDPNVGGVNWLSTPGGWISYAVN